MLFLAVGDSYTIGESVSVSERWAVELDRRLREGGVDVADPEIIARTGWTTGELDHEIDEAAAAGNIFPVKLPVSVDAKFRGPHPRTDPPGFPARAAGSPRFARRRQSAASSVLIPCLGR